ncbi:MAG TPA: hypothetical protein VGE14_10395 [Marmoricola sp.]
MYVERLHAVALAIDVTTRLLATLEDFARDTEVEVRAWPSTTARSLTPATRRRLEHVVAGRTLRGG